MRRLRMKNTVKKRMGYIEREFKDETDPWKI